MNKIIPTLILILICTDLFCQDSLTSQKKISCDPINIAKLEKKFNKAEKRKKNHTLEYSDMSFNIAECYRQKNDTTYLKWYRKNISTCQNVRDRHFCDKENRYFPKTARQSAYSSYYIHDYKRAEVFFQKLIAYFPRTEDYFMLGLILIKLEMLPEAIVEFNNFISKGGDRKKADEWIKFCEEKAKN